MFYSQVPPPACSSKARLNLTDYPSSLVILIKRFQRRYLFTTNPLRSKSLPLTIHVFGNHVIRSLKNVSGRAIVLLEAHGHRCGKCILKI